jgi:hypothetical protein
MLTSLPRFSEASIFLLHSSSRRWPAPLLLLSLLCCRLHKIAGEPSLEADQPGGPEMRQSGGGHVEQMLGGKPQPLLLIHDHMSFA